MKKFLLYAVLCALCASLNGCGLLQRKVVYVPTPVPAPKAEIPRAPEYPVLTRDSTPRQVIEYFLLKTTLQEGYIAQLTKILEGYK